MAELEQKLKYRLEESIKSRDAQQAEIKQLQADLQKLLTKIPRRPRESIPQLEQQMRDLEKKRTTTSMSLTDERQILKQINTIQKTKTQVEEYQAMDQRVQEIKSKLEELKNGQKTQRESIQEIETALAKVKLANSLGCSTQELTTIQFEVPRDKLGMIIGKQGSRIQKLMEIHKVTIDVDKETCLATITGSAGAAQCAKTEMETITRAVDVDVSLSAEVVAYLAAPYIEDLANLKNKYEDLYMDLIRSASKAILRGAPERVEEAQQELLNLNLKSEERTLIGREFISLLGTKGARIEKLVQTHKVVIDVNKSKVDDTAVAVVTGPPNRVADTMIEIQELLDSNREVVETLSVDVIVKQILLAEAGQQIKALQANVNEQLKKEDETANCYLSFPKERQDSPELLVKSRQSTIDTAMSLTEAALKELQTLVVALSVDTYVVPRIIGKGGETIKKLTHGKPCFLEVDRSKGKIVLGASTPEGRDALLADVKQIMTDNSILRIPGDPAMMKAQFREFGRSKGKAELQDLVWVDIDEDNHVFIVRGKEEDLAKAKGVLEEFLINNTLDELAILDEDFDVLLAGGKASKIVTMSDELNVNLSADRSKNIISIRGPSDKVAEAKKKLALFLYGGDGQSVAKITVSDQLVGTIIGKGGKTRKDLEAKYSPVSIHVSKTYKVSVRGPQEKVNECRIEILKMIASARVTQTIPIDSEQEAKLEKNDALKRITQQSHCQLSVTDGTVSVRGFFYDVRDALSLLNEQLTGEYKSSVELSPSQFAKVSSACRDSSHFQRIQLATDAKVALESSSGEIQVCGKRSNVKKGKEQVYDFLSFICPGEIHRLKVSQPLYVTVGNPSSLADVVAGVGGTTIYLDRDIGSIIIRDPDVERVKAAAAIVLTKIQDAERLAFVLELAPDEAWLISYIIGKNGGRIQALQKGSDCYLDVSKESRTITITGDSQDKVAKVRESLEALVEQARRENVFLTIPEKAIPAFVGHGGKRIKDWSTEFGVEIQRVRKSAQFKIIGDGDKPAAAKSALTLWVEQWQESNASHEMPIEKQYISAVLGLKGSTAQAIQEEFDCKIDIDRTTMKLTIRGGDAEKREAAMARIQDIIAKEVAAKAQAAADRKAERKELATEKTKEVPDAPVAVTEANSDHKKENTRENSGNVRSFPSHPVGIKPSGKNEKKGKDNVATTVGTEQGRNLFNLLVEG